MIRNAIVDALGVLKAGRIVDLTHLVHPGIQRFGPFPAMRIETRYTVAESGFHVEEVTFVTQYGTHVDAPEHFVEGRRTLERIELEELMLPLFVLHFEDIDADGVAHCPGWGLDALKYLFEERGVTAVGHETLDTDGSADVRARGFLDCEKYVLEFDHYQVEVMANLDKLPSTGGVIFVGLPKFDKFPGFPACAWAVVPNED